MKYSSLLLLAVTVLNSLFQSVVCRECHIKCKEDERQEQNVICGFDPKMSEYKLFPNECEMRAFVDCENAVIVSTNLKYCINDQIHKARKTYYEESCPAFCPSHYRPVCGASKLRSYVYQTFNNGCYLDMINCRGDEDSGFVEVPLTFCQNHLMKNIFKERVVVTNLDEHISEF